VKCPGCGHKLTIPTAATPAENGEEEESAAPEPPSRRHRRPRHRKDDKEAERAKPLILILACVVLGAQAYDLYRYFDSLVTLGELKQELTTSMMVVIVFEILILVASVVLLVFLYLGHDWARLVLGCMLLLQGVWSVYPLLSILALGLGGIFSGLRAVFWGLILFGFRAGPGLYLLKSETIARYTATR
jgi:hypothetical protein